MNQVRVTGPRGWHSRGYIPHFDGGTLTQMVTFRLADSMPAEILARWENELATLPEAKASEERRRRIEDYLDSQEGEGLLSRPGIADVVERSMLHFDGQRYLLHAWVIMPNHTHALFTPKAGQDLSSIVHSWKSYTAKQANRLLGRSGTFWHADYYDRYIRNEEHFARAVEYIQMNPVKAGLCERAEDWRFGSAGVPPA